MATEYCFTVNGMRRTTTEKKSLLRYLRDDLHLFSVKDGCSEGACGTCTIIVDGVAVKACVLTTDKSVGRNIVTVEGLTEREQDAFVYTECMSYGPGSLQYAHKPDEFVEIRDIIRCEKVMNHLVMSLCEER